MYLDDKMLAVDHICCMAHARAKFRYAFEQGDADAGYFLDRIGELYKLEAEYRSGKLSSDQIGICREGLKTKGILIGIRSKLDALLGDRHPARGELMEKALRYLNTFWQQLFTYLKDGNYSIDNSLAERCIRPLSGERKSRWNSESNSSSLEYCRVVTEEERLFNSLFFGSDKMAMASAAYHTVITTCRMHGISALEYLKRFFREIVMGRRDYANLLPQTIGIISK